jgi:hypothetical protein
VPILKNSKHEQFAHGVAKGLAAGQAYLEAGYSEKGKDQSAARLLRNVQICSRVEEIKTNIENAVEEKVGVSKAWVIAGLREVAERCMATKPLKDSGANRAYELIGRELGMFQGRDLAGNPLTNRVEVVEVGIETDNA